MTCDDPHYGAWCNCLHFGESSLTTPLATMLRYAFFEPAPRRQPAVVADYRVIYLARLQLVERALQGHEYLVGDRFGVADISVGYAFMLARMLKLDEVTPPNLLAYWNRLQQRPRSEEHTSELQSLMRISYAVFCLKKTNKNSKTYANKLQKRTIKKM